MFRTKYDKSEPVYTEPGSGIKIEYQVKETKDGLELEEVGKSDLYAYIQSHADSVDIHKILERCAMIDDYGLLNRRPGVYMDITEMPKNLAEAYDQIQNARNLFDRMPVDIKESYNNSFVEFISDIGKEKFNKVVSNYLDKITVKDNVVKESNKGDVNES